MQLLDGMPIIARINAKQYDICNNDMFIFIQITSDSIVIQLEE